MVWPKNKTILLVTLSVLLTACSSISAVGKAKTPVSITDGYGREVIINTPVERVVSLAPANTEILFAIGAGDKIIGRDAFSNYPQEAERIQNVGGPYADISIETILSLEPDLVLGSELTPPEMVLAMEELGLIVFVVGNPLDIEGLYGNILLQAQFVGDEKQAEALIKDMQTRVSKMEKWVESTEQRPLVFYELDGTDPNAPWTAGPGSYIDTLINLAGGSNLGASYGETWLQLSAEEIIAQNPDVILLGDYIFGVSVEDVIKRPGWNTLKAVQNNQVYPFNDDLVSRPGPRVVEGLETLVELIHPELFE